MAEKKYRVLTLDGGGPWAVLQPMAMQGLFGAETRGHDVLKLFDLVAANGGGTVALAGLAMNLTLKEIIGRLFVDGPNRKTIFGPTKAGWLKAASQIRLEALRSLFDTHHKHTLGALFKQVETSVGYCPDLLVCAFDCDRRRPEFFRSNPRSDSASSTGSWDPTLAEVLQASVTSPIHNFDALAKIEGARFCDGAPAGLFNPIVAAITEARANRRAPDAIQVLSLGSGTLQVPHPEGKGATSEKSKVSSSPAEIQRSIFEDPPDSQTYVAHVLLGQELPTAVNPPPFGAGSVVRMNPVIRVSLETSKELARHGIARPDFDTLAQLERGKLGQDQIRLISRFGTLWMNDHVENEPIRCNRNFKCEIGHERYSLARDHWCRLTGHKLPQPGPTPPPGTPQTTAA